MNARQATIDDCPLLAELNQQLIRDERHRNTLTYPELNQRMMTWLTSDYSAFLFEQQTSSLGYVLFRRETEFVYVRQFFIRPEFRKQGIGTNAFKWMVRNIWGNARIRLDVLTDNSRAMLFWKSLGFSDYCVTMERDPG